MTSQQRTNVVLGTDQFKKLVVLTAAIPRDKSRLIGELIDDEWDQLPQRLQADSRAILGSFILNTFAEAFLSSRSLSMRMRSGRSEG